MHPFNREVTQPSPRFSFKAENPSLKSIEPRGRTKMIHLATKLLLPEIIFTVCHLLADFRRRFLSLLSYQFRSFPASVGLSVLQCKTLKDGKIQGEILYSLC